MEEKLKQKMHKKTLNINRETRKCKQSKFVTSTPLLRKLKRNLVLVTYAGYMHWLYAKKYFIDQPAYQIQIGIGDKDRLDQYAVSAR